MRPSGGGAQLPPPAQAAPGEADGVDEEWASLLHDGQSEAAPIADSPNFTRAAAAAAAAAAWSSGVVCILAAALTFALAAALVKLAMAVQPGLTIYEVIVVRSVLAMLASLGVSRAKGMPLLGRWRHVHLLAARGLFGAASMTSFYATLERLALGETVLLMFLNPVFCAAIAWALLHERVGRRTAAGCLASLLGVACVAQPPFLMQLFFGGEAQAWSHSRSVGVGLGLLSALLAATAYCSVRVIGKRESSLTIAFAFHTCSACTSAVPLALGVPHPAVLPTPRAALCLAGVAATSFAAQLLLNRGFQLESAARASAFNYSQVFWAHLLGIVLFGERLTALGACGALLVAAGVLAVSADKQAAAAAADPANAAPALKSKSSFHHAALPGDKEKAAGVQLGVLQAEPHLRGGR